MEIRKPGMAWTARIERLETIPEADKILRAEVVCGKGGRWSGVVPIQVYAEGDIVVVFLPDAVVPQLPGLEFMERHKWRVQPMKLRGCPSEVLIMPLTFCEGLPTIPGADVTDVLGVFKYEKEVPQSLSGVARGRLPAFIPKSDEPNFQTVPHLVEALIGRPYVITTKIDGTSQTFYHHEGHLGGCSRNLELKDTPTALVWQLAKQWGLPESLPYMGNIAIRWEAAGPKVGTNPLQLTRYEPFVYDVWFIDSQEYLGFEEAQAVIEDLGMPSVPIDTVDESLPFFDDDEFRELARGQYKSGHPREGIVIRPLTETRILGERLSFKVANLDYK